MRQIPSLLLAAVLTFTLLGCNSRKEDSVSFYYCRNPEDNSYYSTGSVIGCENRSIIGHSQDISYLITLYLAGPMDEGLCSPLPDTSRLLSVESRGNEIILIFTDFSTSLTDSEFSLASACLSMTCADFTGCKTVTVISGERSITMNPENVVLRDISPATDHTEGD